MLFVCDTSGFFIGVVLERVCLLEHFGASSHSPPPPEHIPPDLGDED